MSQLSGEERFSQAPNEIWDCLTDAEFLAKCLPDLQGCERDESDRLVCRIRPSLEFVKGTLKVTLEIFDAQPPDCVRIRIHSKGIGSSALVETTVDLTTVDNATQLTWTVEIKELGGLLKPVSRSLVTAAARKVIAEGWTAFRYQLELLADSG